MVLKDLFYGNLYPCENVVSQSVQYKKATLRITDLLQDLSARLSEQDKQMVNDLHQNDLIVQGCQEEEFFQYGFALGVLMMQDVYSLKYFRPDE